MIGLLFKKAKGYLDGKVYLILCLIGVFAFYTITKHYENKGKEAAFVQQLKDKEIKLSQMLEEQKRLEIEVSSLQTEYNEATLKINQQALEIKEIKENEAETVIANHLNGTDRLSIPVIDRHNPECKTTDPRTRSTADTRRVERVTRYELHPDTARFIFNLTKRADQYVNERNQCVKLLEETRNKVIEYNKIITNLNHGKTLNK